MRSRFFRILALPAVLALSGCVYFNTFYNAQKAYDQAVRLRDQRLDKNPEDTVLVSNDEKAKLERSIAKSSKVLELYPGKKKYQPKALFLIGESYLLLGEYSKAITKYEELARFYPDAREMTTAEFHRAKCLFLGGQFLAARPALEKVMNGSPVAEYRREAMGLLAKLELADNSPAAALDLYEKLLREQAHTTESRAMAHFEAAKLAFDLKQWERARGHAVAREEKSLPTQLRYRCQTLAALCLYRLGKPAEGIREFEAMKKNRLYYPSLAEIDLQLAEGWFLLGEPGKALDLLAGVPKQAPKSAWSAEAFYRLGDYQLRELKDEKQAKVYFDSAAAAGADFEYAKLARERSEALGRLADLRKTTDTAAAGSHYRDFMIAELFLFRLDAVDSALSHLDSIVDDPREDSVHSMRAAYARAFIQEEFKENKAVGDSLYRYVLEKYPNTEYARQAERNLGLKPTVETREDKAHRLFLEAEAARFEGRDPAGEVIPAYARVVSEYGETRAAAKAEFVVAMLYERLAGGEEPLPGGRDSAIMAYEVLRSRYPRTPQGEVAIAKLTAAGIKSAPAGSAASPAPTGTAPAAGAASATNAQAPAVPASSATPSPAAPASAAPSAPPVNAPGATPSPPAPQANPSTGPHGAPIQRYPGGAGQPPPASAGQPPPTAAGQPPAAAADSTAPVPKPADTASSRPAAKPKEVIEDEYQNVDQY